MRSGDNLVSQPPMTRCMRRCVDCNVGLGTVGKHFFCGHIVGSVVWSQISPKRVLDIMHGVRR